jgi:hypothetical protein
MRFDSDVPDLLDCWDEASIEENVEGYQEKLASFQANPGFTAVREVILNVPFKSIQAAFKVVVVEATVEDTE